MADGQLVTVREAAAELGLPAFTIRHYCRRGYLVNARKVGGGWRIPSPIKVLPVDPPGPPRKVRAETIRAIRARFQAGDSPSRLARLHGVGETTIRRYCRGIRRGREEVRAAIRERHRNGVTLADLAAEYQLSERTIRQYVEGK